MNTTPSSVMLASALALAPAATGAHPPDPAARHAVTARLQDGDVIFIRVANFVFRHVAETTGSWESHVGILFSDTNGGWEVAESRVPRAQFTPLAKFIARSEHGRFCILRLRNELSPAEKLALRRSAQARVGQWYGLGFNYDSRRQFCSKFVFDVYREAAGVTIGRLTTFRQLLADNPQAPMWFWRVWFFGRIPWDRRCVTTTSELQAQNFRPVFDSIIDRQPPAK